MVKTPPKFDLLLVATDYMNKSKPPISGNHIEQLARHSQNAFMNFISPAPDSFVKANEGIANVLFAQYPPFQRKSVIGSFVLTLKSRAVTISKQEWREMWPSSPRDAIFIGDISRDFFGRLPSTSTFKKHLVDRADPVADLNTEDAMAAAVDVIERVGKTNTKVGGH
jgi:hypothetical protein